MFGKRPFIRVPRTLRVCIYALLLAILSLLLTPLSALACGGMFTADAYTEQANERIIFAIDPGQITLYEQIQYTGTPKSFAWVLPLPAIPTVGSAPISLFQTLDSQTKPVFYIPSSICDAGTTTTSAPAPTNTANNVNVYTSGTVGPYSYDVINSKNPNALTTWLTSHHYKIPAASQSEIKLYTSTHQYFLAMRLQDNASVQEMTPIKITYPVAATEHEFSIPLRMATPMNQTRLGVLLWVFANGRYAPQNYDSLQISDAQIKADPNPNNDYTQLVDDAVDADGGHGFVIDYAQTTADLYTPGNTELTQLQQHYTYLTRMYTNLTPAQITLDPIFGPQSGMSDVSAEHILSGPTGICWGPIAKIGGIILGGVMVFSGLIVIIRRRRQGPTPRMEQGDWRSASRSNHPYL